jgi:RNA polymerase sigma factor (sigma-70 family)
MAGAQPTAVVRHLRRVAATRDAAESDDGQLLRCFVELGNDAAFTALVRRHGPMVLAVCHRVLGNAADAEDALQTTFLVLARKARRVRRPEMLGNWLYGVAYRTALKQRTQARRRRARERVAAVSYWATTGPVRWELRPMLDEALNRLPERYRVPVVLCYLQGKTHAEAARLLGCPRATVATRLRRALERLRALLDGEGRKIAGGALLAAFAENSTAAVSRTALNRVLRAATSFAAGSAQGRAFPPVALLKDIASDELLTLEGGHGHTGCGLGSRCGGNRRHAAASPGGRASDLSRG